MSDELPAYVPLLQQAWQLQEAGRLAEAESLYHEVLQSIPEEPNALCHFGLLRQRQGHVTEAIEFLRRSVEIAPGFAMFHVNLGRALAASGDFVGSEIAYRRALSLSDDALVNNNLGALLNETGRFEEAESHLLAAVRHTPSFAYAWCNLGNLYLELARHDEARRAFLKAASLDPRLMRAEHGALFTMLLDETFGPAELLAAHRDWNNRHAAHLAPQSSPHANVKTPDRRLRVGYVCSDFRDHVLGWNLFPLFREHDRSGFELFGYSNVLAPDGLTDAFRSHFDHWRNIVGISDDQAASLIRGDQIDVLVDLNLHSSETRLLLFARKPAPVQATFGGYPGTTGLSAIDVRLSDPYLDPYGLHDGDYSERTLRMPASFWCYDPEVMAVKNLPLSPLPALSNGFVTFGCLNSFVKVREAMVALWARVLAAVPNSRLLMQAPEGSSRERIRDVFRSGDVDPIRIQFVTRQLRPQYLRTYERVDISLDTLPYNGHTTGLDALWQGVPIVTRVGHTVIGRAGLSQLSNLGLDKELAARTDDQFVELASKLATNLTRLVDLRISLRTRMLASPLIDATGFARGVESALRTAWRQIWCQEKLT